MRQGPNNNNRRSRGRGGNNGGGGGNTNGANNQARRQNVPLRHQNYDSNGPDVRIRGNAFQVYEKYQSLARDAQTAGDRVAAENYQQHAEHYYRIILQINEQERQRQGGTPYPVGNGYGYGGGSSAADGGDDEFDGEEGGDSTGSSNGERDPASY